jgi:tetratricopeptide (TPR) repeat protein
MKSRRIAILAFCVAAVAAGPLLAMDERQADQLRNGKKFEPAIAAYRTLLAGNDITTEQKAKWHWNIYDCYRQLKRLDDALAALDEVLAALPPGDGGARAAMDARYETLRQLNRHDDAARYAAQQAEVVADDLQYSCDWRMRAWNMWTSRKEFALAATAAEKGAAFAAARGDPRRHADFLWLAAEAWWQKPDPERSLQPLKELVKLKPGFGWSETIFRGKSRMVECYQKLDRSADLRDACAAFIPTESAANGRQRWWIHIARSWLADKNYAAAIEAAENALAAQAAMPGFERWAEAQAIIADALIAKGDHDAALAAALLHLNIITTREQFSLAVNRVANILRLIDKKTARATAFAQFATTGEGENPLADFKPLPADRVRKAFAEAEKLLPTDTEPMLQRGLMLAYVGDSKGACDALVEACRRAAGDEIPQAYSMLLYVGLRGQSGHAGSLPVAARYLATGDAGSDTQRLQALLTPAAVARVPGRKVALEALRLQVEEILADPTWPEPGRRDAAAALQRLHSALGSWTEPGLKQWYEDRIAAEREPAVYDRLMPGLLNAVRGTAIHWGDVRAYVQTSPVKPRLDKWLEGTNRAGRNPFAALARLEEQSRPRK